jgi:hypothetical protein
MRPASKDLLDALMHESSSVDCSTRLIVRNLKREDNRSAYGLAMVYLVILGEPRGCLIRTA